MGASKDYYRTNGPNCGYLLMLGISGYLLVVRISGYLLMGRIGGLWLVDVHKFKEGAFRYTILRRRP